MRGDDVAKRLVGWVVAWFLASTVGGCSPGVADARPPTVWVDPLPSSSANVQTGSTTDGGTTPLPPSSASIQTSPTTDGGPTQAPSSSADVRTGSTADGSAIGVQECDDYVETWKACYDPAARAAAMPALQQITAGWRDLAKDPQTRSALAQGCKMALENFPRASCRKGRGQ
jgi:hypothetical protein